MRRAAALAIFALFAGCEDPLTEGTVIEKIYEPARTWTQIVPIFSGKTTIMIPMIHHDDEDFILIVRGRRGGEDIQQRLYVSKKVWDAARTGVWFSASPSSVSLTDKTTRKRA